MTAHLIPDVDGYPESGYALLGRVVDAAMLKALLAEELRFRPARGYGGIRNRTLRVAAQLCHRSRPVREAATGGSHLPAVVKLLGPDVCLTHVQFVTKLPDDESTTSDIPWHQDSGYGELEPPDQDLTVFIALTDMNERNGCLRVVPGSHRAGLSEHGASDVNPALREVDPGGTGLRVPLRAGEALAFAGLLLHGSGPNRSEAPRVALYTRYCTPRVRMLSNDGRPVLDDPDSWMVAGEAPADEPS